MNSRIQVAVAASAVLAVAAISYRIGRARADGIPTMSPLYYSGSLESAGAPVADGTRSVTVTLWDDSAAGAMVCTTPAPSTMFTGGHFRVALSPTCVTAIQSTPDLWVETIVDGNSFGRNKIGAVPFAVEAGRASGASGPLATRIAALESRPGPRQAVVGPVTSSGAPGCSWAGVPSSFVGALSFTAMTAGLYRITSRIRVVGGGGVRIRMGWAGTSPTVTWQQESRAPPGATGEYDLDTALYARLANGTPYTFQLEYCGTASLSDAYGGSAIVVEQLQ